MKLKLICNKNHSWYGAEWSLCPFCHRPAVRARDMQRRDAVIRDVGRGVERSIGIHGEWLDYSRWRVLRVVASEFMELAWAIIWNKRGPHGIEDELRDLAVVSVKGMVWVRGHDE